MNIELSTYEVLHIAQSLRENAGAAYDDERLGCASAKYRLAAKFYALLNDREDDEIFARRTAQCLAMAKAIENEILALAAGDEEEVG